MDRFTVELPGASFISERFFVRISILFTIVLHLHLTAGTFGPVLPGYHHHHHHHQHQYEHNPGPVRWTKPSAQRTNQERPIDVMTDVINDLGAKILDRYLDNAGNVGFSPSGLGFVVVALYEGSAGTSSRQIEQVLGLPDDRRITRIGLRDIHRRLRSYLNADAFLGGLTLNRDDINLRPEYEDILRFYGFDISDSGTEGNSTTNIPMFTGNTTDSTTPSAAGIPDNSTDSITTQMPTSAPSPTTISDAVEIITDMIGLTNSALSMMPSSGNSSASMSSTPDSVAVTNSTSTSATSGTTDSPTTAPTIAAPGIGTAPSTDPTLVDSSPIDGNTNGADSVLTTASVPRLVGPPTDPTTTTGPMQSLSTEPTEMQSQSSSTIGAADTSTIPVTSPMSTNVTASMPMSVGSLADTTLSSATNLETENSTASQSETTTTNPIRKRRGVSHGPGRYFSSSADDGIWLDEFGRLNGQADYSSQDEDVIGEPRRPTEVVFLVNGCDYSRVTAASYTAVLPFAYFPSLRASLLEFPLDDPRYKILVMLPGESNGTRRLARQLTTKPITLRYLRRALQPNWITAVIPSFMLRGFVTLTPFLERLGISDVFDPRAADLSPMSPDLGVYARDIQQSIGVNIRNNAKGGVGGADGGNEDRQSPSADLVRSARGVVGRPPFFTADGAISPPTRGDLHYSPYPGAGNILYEKAHPVPFLVDRPFLYFIIDDETSVTLLAGRIDDPLNSRML